jgi:hypothetical protein
MVIGCVVWMDAINQLSIADKIFQLVVSTVIYKEMIPK